MTGIQDDLATLKARASLIGAEDEVARVEAEIGRLEQERDEQEGYPGIAHDWLQLVKRAEAAEAENAQLKQVNGMLRNTQDVRLRELQAEVARLRDGAMSGVAPDPLDLFEQNIQEEADELVVVIGIDFARTMLEVARVARDLEADVSAITDDGFNLVGHEHILALGAALARLDKDTA